MKPKGSAPADIGAPPSKPVTYNVWLKARPSISAQVTAQTYFFARQKGAVALQAAPDEVEVEIAP